MELLLMRDLATLAALASLLGMVFALLGATRSRP